MTIHQNISQKVQALRNSYIETERFEEIRDKFHGLFMKDDDGQPTATPCRYAGDREVHGLAVIEASGGGKSTAIRRVLKGTAALGINPETNLPRYLELEVPSPATLKSVGLAILTATGMGDVAEKTPTADVWKMVRHRLHRLQIRVLWLDEAQDLVTAKSAGETEGALRMLKSLMQGGEDAVVLILSGTERLREVASYDPQVSRRFVTIRQRDLEYGVDEDLLLAIINAQCELVDLTASVSNDLAARLIKGSRQRFGRAVETIVDAIQNALECGDSLLTSDHFSAAWAAHEGCEIIANVFEAPDWFTLPLDAGAKEYEVARTKRTMKKLEKA